MSSMEKMLSTKTQELFVNQTIPENQPLFSNQAEQLNNNKEPSSKQGETSSMQDETSSMQDETSSIPCEPSSKHGEQSSKQGEPLTKQDEPSSKQVEPSNEKDEPSSKQGEPSIEQGEPSSEQSEVSTEQGELSGEQGELSSEQGELSSEQGELSSEQGELSSEQGDPSTKKPVRQLHSCPVPWGSRGVKAGPVQLHSRDRTEPYHRVILAILNRVMDSKLDWLVSRGLQLLLPPDEFESSDIAEAPCYKNIREDFAAMLIEKANDERMFTYHYCHFIKALGTALDSQMMDWQRHHKVHHLQVVSNCQSLFSLIRTQCIRQFEIHYGKLQQMHCMPLHQISEDKERLLRSRVNTHLELMIALCLFSVIYFEDLERVIGAVSIFAIYIQNSMPPNPPPTASPTLPNNIANPACIKNSDVMELVDLYRFILEYHQHVNNDNQVNEGNEADFHNRLHIVWPKQGMNVVSLSLELLATFLYKMGTLNVLPGGLDLNSNRLCQALETAVKLNTFMLRSGCMLLNTRQVFLVQRTSDCKERGWRNPAGFINRFG